MPNKTRQPIVLGISGASGMPYALRLLEVLLGAGERVFLLISNAAYSVFELEMQLELPREMADLHAYFVGRYACASEQLHCFSEREWTSPVASGSALTRAMVICPCSSGCLSAVAHGQSNNLLERAADVTLKERRPLLLVHRETPLSTLHLENMLKLSRMGATVLPASPGFYHRPESIAQLVDFVVARVCDHLQVQHELVPRWPNDAIATKA